MNVSIFIAQRYLYTAKQKKIVHLMSIVAYIGIAISTTSLLLSSGVHNGLERLVMEVLKSIDYDIKISPVKGKNFDSNIELIHRIQKIDGIESIAEVMESNVMLVHGKNSAIACLRGVRNYGDKKIDKLQKYIIVGNYSQDERNMAIIGTGIAYTLDVRSQGQLIEIRSLKKINRKSFLPLSKPYNSKKIYISGIFSIDKQNDAKFIITHLAFAQNLTNEHGKISSIEVNFEPNQKKKYIQNAIKAIIADDRFQVKGIDEQQATLMQAIKIEKLCTRIIFIILMFISALNIFFALSILTLIKRKDIYTLYTLGATRNAIAKVFISTGLFIAIRGAIIGAIIAYSLAWIQQKYGVVSLGTSIATTGTYPVDIHWSDFLSTIISVVSITLLASWLPARWSRKLLHQQN